MHKPPWNYLVVQAATMRGTVATTWAASPGQPAQARLSTDDFFRDCLPLRWELSPFEMLDEKMAAQP
eukprot:14586029-Alexandrium_andersonii.AAC.1